MRDLKRHATYADLEALPKHVVGELLDGELFASPRPRRKHALSGGRLYSAIDGTLGGRGGGGSGAWIILIEPELHFGSDVLVPDVSGWRAERLPPDEGDEPPYFTTAPDWVCEVLSPSTARLDRIRKLPRYAKVGVPFAWIVDPLAKTLEVYAAEHERMALVQTFEGDAKVHAKPFETFELNMATMWTP